MATIARDMKDFLSFPGRIVEEKGWYEFPILYKRTKTKAIKQWQMIIRLVKKTKNITKEHREQNWSVMTDLQVPVKKEYLTDEESIPEKTIAQFWTESGFINMKISRFPPDYASAKNVGRANERNALMSAMIEVRDKFMDMAAKGYCESLETVQKNKKVKIKNSMTYPMLALKFKENRDEVKYPAIVQPKLDGVHFIAFLKRTNLEDTPDEDDVVIYSRSNKDFPGFSHLREQLLPILIQLYDTENMESIYLDGEFYYHNLLLQEITSIARNKAKNERPKEHKLEMWLFDCFYPSRKDILEVRYERLSNIFADKPIKTKTYEFDRDRMLASARELEDMLKLEKERGIPEDFRGYEDIHELRDMISILEKKGDSFGNVQSSITVRKWQYLVLVPNQKVESFLELQYYYYGLLSVGFEGAMIRNYGSKYITNLDSDNSRRSPDLLKHKPTYTKEFPVIDFTKGKGSNAKAIIWVCKVPETDSEFNVVPKHTTLEARRKLYKKVSKDDNFEERYKGRMLGVEYEDVGDSGVPLRAKGIGFRNID